MADAQEKHSLRVMMPTTFQPYGLPAVRLKQLGDMSLVMSQVAAGIGHSSHHPIMVGGGPHQDATSQTPQRDSRERSASSTTSTLRPAPTTDAPPQPRSPAIQPRNTLSSSSQATPVASTRPQIQEPPASAGSESTWSSSATLTASSQQNRGYDQSGFPLSSEPGGLAVDSPNSPRLQPTYRSTRSLGGSEATSPSRIKIRDLSHIQSFASEEMLNRPRMRHRPSDAGTQYEISAMPVADIIEMVAGLLTRITSANDQQHDYVHRPIPTSEEQANMSAQSSCVLAFHGKNVPSITILSYLSRIHKYCPTTYEVFLSLLVYFDRMTEMVNKGFLDTPRPPTSQTSASPVASISGRSPLPMNVDSPRTGSNNPSADLVNTPPASGSMEPVDQARSSSVPTSPTIPGQSDLSQFFVVDSYNIHRLVIAGVTCASKFFSDVFYTNSRYAKVGGLPLNELNHLELQFLLLNDFRLSVPVEELEAYGTMLVEFYAREVVAQQQADAARLQAQAQQAGGDGIYITNRTAQPAPQLVTPP